MALGSFARAGLLVPMVMAFESGERLEAVLQCTAAEAVSSSRDHLVICSVEAASKQEASRSKAKRWCSYTEAVRGRLVGFRCRRRSRRATNARGLWVSGVRRGRMKVAKAHSEWRPEL